MKKLKIILAVIYPVLALLLLLNLSGYMHNDDSALRIVAPDSAVVAPNNGTPTDDSRVVGRARRVGNIGTLKVTLLWDFPGDIDLHVLQPTGNKISYSNPRDYATGGYLDVDNRRGSSGAAENIFWANAPKGEYRVSINYYGVSNSSGHAGSGICTIVVFQQGQDTKVYRANMSNIGETKYITKILVEP